MYLSLYTHIYIYIFIGDPALLHRDPVPGPGGGPLPRLLQPAVRLPAHARPLRRRRAAHFGAAADVAHLEARGDLGRLPRLPPHRLPEAIMFILRYDGTDDMMTTNTISSHIRYY